MMAGPIPSPTAPSRRGRSAGVLRRAAGILTLALALLAPPAQAEAVPEVRIVEWGEYVVRRDTGTLDPRFGATGISPVVTVEGVRFVERTTRIEARLCRRFGILFEGTRLGRWGTARVTIRLTHPPLVRPDGRTGAEATWELPLEVGGPALAGYALEEPWELAPGAWTFAVLLGGRVLAEQRFELVPAPGGGGAPQGDDCGEPPVS